MDSVQGLQRRVNGYLSDWPRLALLYETEIAASADITTLSDIIDEGDRVLLSRDIPYNSQEQPFTSTADTPLLTFTQTMKWLRQYNLDNQSMPKVTVRMPARWAAAGNRVNGLQIDFDAATYQLDKYAVFLDKLRGRLPHLTIGGKWFFC